MACLILLLIRGTEDNSKLKTRYEQAKEETENLVSKLKRFFSVFCAVQDVSFVFYFQRIIFRLHFAERES